MFWWGLIVLVLLGIHTHQLWMEKTRITFNATLAGQTPALAATATFDGQLIFSGQKIPLGRHWFEVTHPKGETFSTNLFIWYGAHNFGTIDLKRTMGTLLVTADPPADFLVIHGPEWSKTLTDSSGLDQLVPTDIYEIEARYPHWQKKYTVSVYAHQTSPCSFAPHFGGLKLGCNQSDAMYDLQAADGQWVAAGNLPATLSGLPAGEFKLTATHHGHQQTETLVVKPDTTVDAQIDFQYGTVVFETSPAGVTVVTDNGNNCGTTPLRLTELVPGNWNFTLQRSGYQSVPVAVTVIANQTSYIHTNLVSENYLHAVATAREDLAKEDYDQALQAADAALAASPGDAEALMLHREATGRRLMQHAKMLAQQGDYIGGGRELARALQVLPDNAEARRLVADYRRHEPEQIARQREERMAWPKKNFDAFIGQVSGAAMFENHEVRTSKSVGEVHAAIVAKLQSAQPPFKIARSDLSPVPEISQIDATQTIPGGVRRCIIVSSQSKDDETRIYFVVLEAKKIGFMQQPITSLMGATPMEYSLINPRGDLTDKQITQISEGVSVVTSIIQSAIGQTPAPALP